MELQCPQCGKWMAVSQEELVMHDSQVVCPQCLAVCCYENGTLVARDDSDAPYRHIATVDASSHDKESRFCHRCGKQLPPGISFCPYCGTDLGAPFEKDQPQQEKRTVAAPAAQEPVAVPQRDKEKKADAPPVKKRPSPVAQPDRVEEKLRTVSRHYTSVHPRLHQNGTMPGTAFKVVAYVVIALLLFLLGFIIYAGSTLE